MPGSEVVITGVGSLSPLGADAPTSADAWRADAIAATRLLPELAETPLADMPVGVLPDFDPVSRLGNRRMLKYMSDAARYGCIAAREAILQARVGERFAPERVGLYAGTGLTAADLKEVGPMIRASTDAEGRFSTRLLGESGLPATNPLLSFKILANMPPCLISVIAGIKGPNYIFNPWEGHAAGALIEAWEAVKSGMVDCAVAGAADNPAHAASMVYLRQVGNLCGKEFPSPGAGYVVMERRSRATVDDMKPICGIDDMSLTPDTRGIDDPMADRIGRTFAAAPALLLGLSALGQKETGTVCGVDQQRFAFRLEPQE